MEAYSATRYTDTTCAAMTNIWCFRIKESKASKFCFCPLAKLCTPLWATSDFTTIWCNATSHALALALQLEQALSILSPELIIHPDTQSETHTCKHTRKKKATHLLCRALRLTLSVSVSSCSTNALMQPRYLHFTLFRPLKPLQILQRVKHTVAVNSGSRDVPLQKSELPS